MSEEPEDALVYTLREIQTWDEARQSIAAVTIRGALKNVYVKVVQL